MILKSCRLSCNHSFQKLEHNNLWMKATKIMCPCTDVQIDICCTVSSVLISALFQRMLNILTGTVIAATHCDRFESWLHVYNHLHNLSWAFVCSSGKVVVHFSYIMQNAKLLKFGFYYLLLSLALI